MRKNLTILIALLVAVAVAAPAMAAVEFKYGGQFRARWISANNIVDGSDDDIGAFVRGNDHSNFADQRLRLYFTFQSSENLKLVVKLEMGDIVWGKSAGNIGRVGNGAGGGIGADGVNIELKNAYIDFAIPCTPTRGLVGIQSVTLLDSWIVDDDYSAALLVTKLDPFKITVGYIAAQNLPDPDSDFSVRNTLFNRESDNIDDFFVSIDWAMKPFKASLIGFYQYGHQTGASFIPFTVNTPLSTGIPTDTGQLFGRNVISIQDNQFFDLGFNFTYQVEWLKAYVNFVKNFGSVDAVIDTDDFFPTDDRFAFRSRDYTGWMVDAGVYYYCGPWTLNLQGFYTTGQKLENVVDTEFQVPYKAYNTAKDFDWFMYPAGAPSKYFSEIVGGGILDASPMAGSLGQGFAPGTNFWRGYNAPTNLWTISAGAAWQVLPKTKLSLSYWYFATAEDVMAKATFDAFGNFSGQKLANDIGHEIDFYLTQGIVDGLTLDLVGAYMFTGDAFVNSWNGRFGPDIDGFTARNFSKDDAWKLGARLQWNF